MELSTKQERFSALSLAQSENRLSAFRVGLKLLCLHAYVVKYLLLCRITCLVNSINQEF